MTLVLLLLQMEWRVVVNQMHRSPGVFFDHDKEKHTQVENCYLIVE